MDQQICSFFLTLLWTFEDVTILLGIGLLLVARGILLIVLTLTYTTTPSASLLYLVIILTILIVVLVYTGRVYNNWLLSLLECSFMVNLQVLGATILFIDLELSDTNKEIVVNTSVGIVFVQYYLLLLL